MKTSIASVLFLLIFAALPLAADSTSKAIQKLQLIPDAPLVITMDQASGSPSLVLTAKGALINQSTTPLPFEQILRKLAALPKSAWPYGRVIFYSPSSGASGPAKPVVDKVESDLQKANIRLLRTAAR